MSTATVNPLEATAEALGNWFASISELSGRAYGWHRETHGAPALHVLRRLAARLRSSRLAENGESYTALCLFLAAACRALGIALTQRHWASALRSVAEQRAFAPDESLGMALGSPAERFKLLLDDAIDAAGLGSQATVLDEKNRRLALGLAVNWGVRTLLAYAADTKPTKASTDAGRRDLAWLRTRVRRIESSA